MAIEKPLIAVKSLRMASQIGAALIADTHGLIAARHPVYDLPKEQMCPRTACQYAPVAISPRCRKNQ
ncbi:MAG: hypothetical protein ABSD48_12810 [Armatimonadota bacterium]|jgi:hypothetical protein